MSKSTLKTTIGGLQRMLAFGNYPSQVMPLPGAAGLEHLAVGPFGFINAAGDEDPRRQIVVDLAWINDLNQAAKRPQDSYTDSLQFLVLLPFDVPPERATEVCRLIAAYNLLLPLGHFLLDGEDRLVLCYRLKVSHERDLAGHIVIEVLDQLLFFVNKFSRRLQAVALGQINADQAREHTEKDLAGLS